MSTATSMLPLKSSLCALSGISLGIWAFVTTQSVTKDMFQPILQGCSDPDSKAAEELRPYEPVLGGTFVCLITQFLYQLTDEAAGVFAWGAIVGLGLPLTLLMNVEAGKSYSRYNIVRYPTIMGVLGQVLGISVVFPLLWLPGYCLGGSGRLGMVSVARVYLSAALTLPFTILTFLLFTLDRDSYAWTCCAGLLGGPIVACSPVLLWPLTDRKASSTLEKAKAAVTLANAYIVVGMVSFVGWVVNVRLITRAYGYDLSTIWNTLWIDAHPAVAFMTIDTGVLFAAVLICMVRWNWSEAVRSLLISPLIGPGAACALSFSRLERQRATVDLAVGVKEKKL